MLSNYGYEDGSGNYYITIDTDKCSECGEKPCLQACPEGIFQTELDDYDDECPGRSAQQAASDMCSL